MLALTVIEKTFAGEVLANHYSPKNSPFRVVEGENACHGNKS
jgi:hypothetical protein